MQVHEHDTILYLRQEDVKVACAEVDSVAIIREVFMLHASGQTVLPDEAYLTWRNDKDESVRSLNMPGYIGGSLHIAGTKIINGNILNPTRGLPRANGLTILYDNISGRPICIMEGAYLSSLRTASVTALAVDVLANSNIECMAILGAGALAQMHINLLVKRFPQLRQIILFDIDQERITLLQSNVSALLSDHHVTLMIASTAEDAIKPAQLIVPVTTTTNGYIHFAWLQPGSLLVNISLDDPLPEVVLEADIVIVDDWNLVKNDTRRLLGRMYREGRIIGPDETVVNVTSNYRKIDAQLGEILIGKEAGRRKASDIILVNPFGLAIEDIALATQVYQRALKLELGVLLER